MLPVLYLAFVTAILHFVLKIALQAIRRQQTMRKLAQEHSCKPAPRETAWDLLGLYKVASAAHHVINETSLPTAIRLFETHGKTYSSRLLGQRVFFTCHPLNIREILVSRFADFDSSKGIRDHLFKPITPRGIFALDGVEWKAARARYRDIFSNTRRILDLDLQEKCFMNLISLIPNNQKTDLQPLFLRLTLDLTTAFAIGESVDSLSPEQTLAQREFVDALVYIKKTMARDGFLGPLHVFLSKKKFHASCAVVHHFIEDRVRRQLAARRSGNTSSTSRPPCILDTLIEDSSDIQDIRDGVITILIAGIDSVVSLLSTTFFLLAKHPRVFKELRDSVLAVAGQSKPPTYDMLRSMTYLRYVLNETMRVYPPVPFNARTANKDTFLSKGGGPDAESSVLIGKGQRVVFSSWASHRSFEYFGEDAHDFRPERWSSLKAEALGFVPFNLGPRGCPGQNFALMEASYVTARLLQTFSSLESMDDRAWTEHLGLNLTNKNGTVVKLSYSNEKSAI